MADVMSPSNALVLVERYVPEWESNRDDVDLVDRWYRGTLVEADKPVLSGHSTREYRELRDRSATRWLELVVTTVAQSLYVEGYRRSTGDEGNAAAWRAWQRNSLDGRQSRVHRGALAHGLHYVTLMPGSADREFIPTMRTVSARKMVTWWDDRANDEWPIYALTGEKVTSDTTRFVLYDHSARYVVDRVSDRFMFVGAEVHGFGECPVVRFANQLDSDGRTTGEVEPHIDLAARINQDTFDRLIVQRFGAWLLRWVAGMELADPDLDPDADSKNRALKAKIAVEDILLIDSPDAKLGAFPATPLGGYIDSRDADIRDLAAVTQTPPHHLLGHVANLSAEALAAAEAGLTRKVNERKHQYGESWEQVLRGAAHLMGDTEGAADFSAEVRWSDTESRSLAQAADALLKLREVGVPIRLLLEKVPGFTQQDIDMAMAEIDDASAMAELASKIEGSLRGGADTG